MGLRRRPREAMKKEVRQRRDEGGRVA